MFKHWKIWIILGIILLGSLTLMMSSNDGVYEGYKDMYKTNVGYDSKSQFAKQYSYETKKEIVDSNTDDTSNANQSTTEVVISQDGKTWWCSYDDFAGPVTTIEGITYKIGDKGPAMPLMYQGHGSIWSGFELAPYDGKYHNIAYSGCGFTSTAMVLTYLLQRNVTPDEIYNEGGKKYYHSNAGVTHDIFPWAMSHYGLQGKFCNFDEFKQGLIEGKVGISNTAKQGDSYDYWSSGGHIIAVRGVTDDGLFLVNNPNIRGEAQLNREWTDAEMKRNCGIYFLAWK